ncbi:unnamed protein product [Ranitomeya imitator]|uniref:Uncharacterized protein n=1 Tax=Ranitomeya imitator TaxID=111125 RepID=A0ABN9LEC6_9NEOB|nr:unnamed protein product [Ranitomeya imitator]
MDLGSRLRNAKLNLSNARARVSNVSKDKLEVMEVMEVMEDKASSAKLVNRVMEDTMEASRDTKEASRDTMEASRDTMEAKDNMADRACLSVMINMVVDINAILSEVRVPSHSGTFVATTVRFVTFQRYPYDIAVSDMQQRSGILLRIIKI